MFPDDSQLPRPFRISPTCLQTPDSSQVAEGASTWLRLKRGHSWPAGGSVGSGWCRSHLPAFLSLNISLFAWAWKLCLSHQGVIESTQFSSVQYILNFACYISDLGKLLNLSVPKCPRLQNRNNFTHLLGLNRVICAKNT